MAAIVGIVGGGRAGPAVACLNRAHAVDAIDGAGTTAARSPAAVGAAHFSFAIRGAFANSVHADVVGQADALPATTTTTVVAALLTFASWGAFANAVRTDVVGQANALPATAAAAVVTTVLPDTAWLTGRLLDTVEALLVILKLADVAVAQRRAVDVLQSTILAPHKNGAFALALRSDVTTIILAAARAVEAIAARSASAAGTAATVESALLPVAAGLAARSVWCTKRIVKFSEQIIAVAARSAATVQAALFPLATRLAAGAVRCAERISNPTAQAQAHTAIAAATVRSAFLALAGRGTRFFAPGTGNAGLAGFGRESVQPNESPLAHAGDHSEGQQ